MKLPSDDQIPEAFRLSGPIEQREWLVGGQLVQWEGALNEVRSPVWHQGATGPEPRLLGSTPLLTTRESMDALNAAVKAYDLGRGAWPTMSVQGRIEHVEKFIVAMRSKRAEVVKLLCSDQQLQKPRPQRPYHDADENPHQHRESDFEGSHAPPFE